MRLYWLDRQKEEESKSLARSDVRRSEWGYSAAEVWTR